MDWFVKPSPAKGAFGPAGYVSAAESYRLYPDAMRPRTPSTKDIYKGAPRRQDNAEKLKAARKLRKRLKGKMA
jgi:hypothetical protein